MIEFWLQCLIVMGCIVIGARSGGIGIGLAGGFGLTLLVFVFNLRPSSPPISVLLIIVAVITLVSTMQAAGGLDYLVGVAERILRRNPHQITILAPMIAYIFTLFTGTAYVALSLFPIIVETAIEAKVRPERPLSMSLIASKLGITGSPMSAATVAILALVSPMGITLPQIMLVCIPAGLIATLVGSLFVYKRGLELEDDPEYQRRLAAGEITAAQAVERQLDVPFKTKLSVVIFVIATVLVVLVGVFTSLLPSWEVGGKIVRLSSPNAIEILMLGSAFLIAQICGIKTGSVINSSVFRYGMVGVVAIFGIAWMTDTFFLQHKALFIDACSELVRSYPWLFAIVLFFMSALLFSQGATVPAFMPLGLALGLSPAFMVGLFPSVNGNYFFPATGNVVAAIAFDRSGTTKIGSYVLNHSFMLPGLLSTFVMTVISLALSKVIF